MQQLDIKIDQDEMVLDAQANISRETEEMTDESTSVEVETDERAADV